MEFRDSATLLSIASPWPIAITLATYLPAGDLINLARTSVLLRAVLHGFLPPSAGDLQVTSYSHSRPALRIGGHQTSYWKQLKQAAPFLCASSTHTKGSGPRPCTYCSAPICEACIVKDSFAKLAENTFKNRCRFLCKDCWNSGNPQRRCRITGKPFSTQDGPLRYNFAPGNGEFCSCTNKDDGWVCISCKNVQNTEAMANGFRLCFGAGCTAILEEDKDRRRICLWCDRPMLRGRASIESRLAFDQKLQDARAKRGLSSEEGARKQQKLCKMSRRELRGDKAVAQDFEADTPQFVRHMDTINYQRFMRREDTPSGEQVYQSKLGRWVYDRNFLLEIGKWCRRLPKCDDMRNLTRRNDGQKERTNLEKSESQRERRRMKRHSKSDSMNSWDENSSTMLQLRGSDRNEPLGLRRIRQSFLLPAEANAAEPVETNPSESDSFQDVSDDYAAALNLQAELDREMAESLEAEFIAEAAEEARVAQFESNSAESESERESLHHLTSHNFAAEENWDVKNRKYASKGDENDVALSRSYPQLKTSVHGDTSNVGDNGYQNALYVPGSSVAPEQASNFGVAGDDLSDLTTSPMWPETNFGELDNEA